MDIAVETDIIPQGWEDRPEDSTVGLMFKFLATGDTIEIYVDGVLWAIADWANVKKFFKKCIMLFR